MISNESIAAQMVSISSRLMQEYALRFMKQGLRLSTSTSDSYGNAQLSVMVESNGECIGEKTNYGRRLSRCFLIRTAKDIARFPQQWSELLARIGDTDYNYTEPYDEEEYM